MDNLTFTPRNENYETRVRESFARQKFMTTLGASIPVVKAGYVEIELPFNEGLGQQHGFFHGGVVGTLGDNGCGYSAFSLMDATSSVLSVEYKINFIAPAKGEKLISKGRVIKPGKTLVISQADLYVVNDGIEKHCATVLGTMMVMKDTPDEPA